jgi:hypothetical protein
MLDSDSRIPIVNFVPVVDFDKLDARVLLEILGIIGDMVNRLVAVVVVAVLFIDLIFVSFLEIVRDNVFILRWVPIFRPQFWLIVII